MKTLAIFAALALASSAQAATNDYPPGLFENSPETGGADHKQWTHMPDGRWMFVDPHQSQQMCDFEHHCYPDTQAATPPTSPSPPANDPPLASPPAMEDSSMCDEIRHRLFQSWHELQQAHQLCGP